MAVRNHALFRRYENPPPDAAQGASYIYHSGEAGVDTGVLVYGEGTLCLSLQEIQELAEVAGFSVNAEAFQLEQENAYLTDRVKELVAHNQELIDNLKAVGAAIKAAG